MNHWYEQLVPKRVREYKDEFTLAHERWVLRYHRERRYRKRKATREAWKYVVLS